MLEEEEEEEEEKGAGRNPTTSALVDAINRLSEEMGQMQRRMQGIMGDMFWVMGELQRVNGRHSTSAAPPPDEHSFIAQPNTGPIGENNSTPPILPNAYGIHPINPPTPTIHSWMHPYQFPAVPEAGTPTAGTTHARTDINLFDPVYQDDSGPQYIEGSSTGLSARETGEMWQYDFADEDSM